MLSSLKGDKFNIKLNESTNGLAIANISLHCSLFKDAHTSSSSKLRIPYISSKQGKTIQFNVMDFGGQAIFHSTHRIFFTCNAIYLVMFKLNDPHSFRRVEYPIFYVWFLFYCEKFETLTIIKHWIQQIRALLGQNNTPILIVGTHADEVVKQHEDPQEKMQSFIDTLKKNPEMLQVGIQLLLLCF